MAINWEVWQGMMQLIVEQRQCNSSFDLKNAAHPTSVYCDRRLFLGGLCDRRGSNKRLECERNICTW